MPRLSLLLVLATLLLASPAAGRGDAAAPAAALPPAVTATTFFVSGRGWGHGVGMSQYGALALASDGVTHDRILTHFYTGVTLGPAPVARVRVLVAEAQPAITVASTVPFRVRDVFGKTYPLDAGSVALGSRLELTLNGAPTKLVGPVVLLPGAAPLTLGRTPYRGQLVVSLVAGKLDVVNDVGLEQYLAGVVPREVPASWPAEALKAQAVAARSYALANRVTGRPYDLHSDVRSQVYGGVAAEDSRATAAIGATAGQVMLFSGRVVNALFHSTSGGRTASAAEVFGAQVPYLVPVDDRGSARSPVHAWGPVTVTDIAVRKALKLGTPVRSLRLVRSESGRVATAVVATAAGERTFRGTELRSALGLRSTWITSVGTLSLTRPGGPVVHGAPVTVTGLATGVRDLVLAQRVGGTWQPVVRRAAPGALATTLRPTTPQTLRLSTGKFGGPTLRVPVAPRVTAKRAAAGLVGVVVPARTAVWVEVQRLDGDTWRPAPEAAVALEADGRFRAEGALGSGSYRVRVAPAAGYAQGLSGVVRVP